MVLQNCLADEELHALSAMLKDNQTIAELNLRGNLITDDGCRALASILSSKSSLSVIDLRSNRISRKGIKLLVEALERSPIVRHVHVHAGGNIEAFGITNDVGEDNKGMTVCIVDVRDNLKPDYSN